MSLETIGVAQKSVGELEQPGSGVAFRMPYSPESYDISFDNADLDMLLRRAQRKILDNKELSGYDYQAELVQPDLPVYVGVRSMNATGNPGKCVAVALGIAIVTQSMANEHRGTLHTFRTGWNGVWRYIAYATDPPLRYLE
jgi:hypothetical protein